MKRDRVIHRVSRVSESSTLRREFDHRYNNTVSRDRKIRRTYFSCTKVCKIRRSGFSHATPLAPLCYVSLSFDDLFIRLVCFVGIDKALLDTLNCSLLSWRRHFPSSNLDNSSSTIERRLKNFSSGCIAVRQIFL